MVAGCGAEAEAVGFVTEVAAAFDDVEGGQGVNGVGHFRISPSVAEELEVVVVDG